MELATHEPVDDEAVRHVLEGDTQAFTALVERHYLRVYRFIRRRVPLADLADDLAQETFLQAYRVLASFSAQSRFSTWLLGIARNVVLNFVNRDWQAHEVPDDAPAAERAPDPAQLSARGQALDQLQHAIDQLSPALRDPLLLVALEDLDYADAALVLGIPVGTVKSRISRARQQLRAVLGQDFFEAMQPLSGT